MNRRVLTLLPILLGGATGAAFALIGADPKEPVGTSASEATTAELYTLSPSSSLAPEAALSAPEPALNAPEAALRAPEVEPSAAQPPAASSGSLPTGSQKLVPAAGHSESPPAPAFDLAEPANKQALLATEVRCNQKIPEDCERAAVALDKGDVVAKDPNRALMLRRMALTLYVKQCETGRPEACARLAEMYEQGILLKQNARSARALRERVITLCKRKGDASVCRSP
jgi:hypothetical protein